MEPSKKYHARADTASQMLIQRERPARMVFAGDRLSYAAGEHILTSHHLPVLPLLWRMSGGFVSTRFQSPGSQQHRRLIRLIGTTTSRAPQ